MGFREIDPSELMDEAAQPAAAQPIAAPKFREITEEELLPTYADGSSPSAPLNKSPISVEERFKLAFGREKDNESYLKQKFKDVTRDKDGNFVVNDGQSWYRVDPNSFADVDPWQATKELMKVGFASYFGQAGAAIEKNKVAKKIIEEGAGEVAENIPTAGAIAATTAAAAATGGASIGVQIGAAAAAGAGTSLVKTSLGRAMGTYEATPEEQLMDAGFEGTLNALGTAIPLGFKPTAKFIGEKLPFMARAYEKMSAPARAGLKKTFGYMSKVGEDNLDHAMTYADDVARTMKEVGSSFKDSEFDNELVRRSIKEVKSVAASAEDVLREVYRAQSDDILTAVSGNFAGNIDDLVSGVYRDAINDGIVVLKPMKEEVAEAGLKNLPEGFLGFSGPSKTLSQAKALAAIEANGGKIPSGMKIVLRDKDDIVRHIQNSGKFAGDGVAFDDEAYGLLSDYFKQLGNIRKIRGLKGKDAAKQLLQANRVLDDLSYKLAQQADDAGINSVRRRMAQYHEHVKGGMTRLFDEHAGKGLFGNLQATYSSMKNEFSDLLSASRRAAKASSNAPYEQLLSKITSKPGKYATQKEGFNSALEIAEKYGSRQVKKIRAAQQAIRTNQAARAFNPIVRKDLLGGLAYGAIGQAAYTGGLSIPTAVGMAAVTSPRTQLNLIRATNSGREFLMKIGTKGAETLFQDPALSQAFFQSIIQSPMIQEDVKSTLLGGSGEQPR